MMKPQTIVLMVMPFIVFFAFAQTQEMNRVHDRNETCRVKYVYKIPAERTILKTAILNFNNSTSNFIYNRTDLERAKDANITSEGNSARMSLSVSDEKGKVFYRNFNTKEIRVRIPKVGKLLRSYCYDDNWIEIVWKIYDNVKKIGGFKVKKAVGEFRGRTYTAWFSEQIPLPYGPWKLFGLPGLILEAEDSEKMFQIKFVSIKYPYKEGNLDISKPTAKEEKTLEEHVEFRDHFHDHISKAIQSRLPRNVAVWMRRIPRKNRGRKYWEEKVFEWEVDEKKEDRH